MTDDGRTAPLEPYARLDAWTWPKGISVRFYRLGFYIGLPEMKRPLGFSRSEICLHFVGWWWNTEQDTPGRH